MAASLKGQDLKKACKAHDSGASLLKLMSAEMKNQVKDVNLGAAMVGQAIIASHELCNTASAFIDVLANAADRRTKVSSLFRTEEDEDEYLLQPQLSDDLDANVLKNAGTCRVGLLKEALSILSDAVGENSTSPDESMVQVAENLIKYLNVVGGYMGAEPFTKGVLPAFVFFRYMESKEATSQDDYAQAATFVKILKSWTPTDMKRDLQTLGGVALAARCEEQCAEWIAVVTALQATQVKDGSKILLGSWQVECATRVLQVLYVPRNADEEASFMAMMGEENPKVVKGPTQQPRLTLTSGGLLKCQELLEQRLSSFAEEYPNVSCQDTYI